MKKFNVFLLIAVTTIMIMSGCSAQNNGEVEDALNETTISITETKSEKEIPVSETTSSETKTTTAKIIETEITTTQPNAVWANERDMLGDDLYSYQCLINGEFYYFPMTMKDLMEKGWKPSSGKEDSFDDMIFPYSIYWGSYMLEKGDIILHASVFNTNIDTVKVSDCIVYGVTIDEHLGAQHPEVVLPGGITTGQSAIEDVKAMYGEPTREYEVNEDTIYFSYTQGTYKEIEMIFRNGILDEIGYIHNLVYEDPDTDVDTSVNDEKVKNELLSKYASPDELSSEITDFTFMLDEKAYVLPVPVQVLIDNGWKLDAEDSNVNLLPNDVMYVDFYTGNRNQIVEARVRNTSEFCVSVDCCEITEIYSIDANLRLPLDIFIGLDEKTFLTSIENTDYEADERYNPIYYWYSDSGYGYVCVSVDDGQVKSITLKMS